MLLPPPPEQYQHWECPECGQLLPFTMQQCDCGLQPLDPPQDQQFLSYGQSYDSALEFIKQAGMAEPTGVLELYLLTDLDELILHQKLIAFMTYRWKEARAHIKKEISTAVYHQNQRRLAVLEQYLRSVNTSTGRAWSVEAGKELCKLDSIWRGFEAQIIDLQFRDQQIEAYEEGLRVKASIMPALQGRQNRRE